MPLSLHRPQSKAGFTLLELATAVSILSIVLGSIFLATTGTQNLFLENQALSQLNLRAQIAMDRLVELSSQALTGDAKFSPLEPPTGVDSHCLRFRLIDHMDPVTADPVYDDAAKVYLCGPNSGAEPCRGLIVGRGSDRAAVYAGGKGADNFLGTSDDDTSTLLPSGVQAVELLLSSTFAPRTGDMFTVNVSPPPYGRLLTFSLRLNMVGPDGSFLLPNDLSLVEQVALRQ